MAVDKDRIKEAAINLVRAFDALPPEAESIRGWRRTYNRLIQRALNGEINEEVSYEDKDYPGTYFQTEGGFRNYPDLDTAISRFRMEVDGSRDRFEKIDARREQEKKSQQS